MKKLNLTKRKKIIIGVVLVLLIGGLIFWLNRDKAADVAEDITQPDKKYYSQLTGMEVPEEVSEQPVLGVMIENSQEERPQSGLDNAGIVFETVTEAGITRYLALFQENMPAVVGPVRSVRPAFVDWVMGFDASIAHVGGSEAALDMIEDRDYPKDMNEFAHGDAFYRRPDREAPHDAYARTADLVNLQRELEHKTSKFDAIPFEDGVGLNPPTVTTITVQFSHPIFTASFAYDPTTNSYTRSLAGVPHLDEATNKPITVKNVIVFKQDIQGGAIGSGIGTLFRNGASQNIKWEQKDYESRITFTDDQGNEVPLNRGDTWISVIPPSGAVTSQ